MLDKVHIMALPLIKNENISCVKSLRRWILPLLIILAMVITFFSGVLDYFSFSELLRQREFLNSFIADNIALSSLLFIFLYIVIVVLSLPGGALMTLSSGLLFGWVWGSFLTVNAAVIGSAIIFWVAKSSVGVLLEQRAAPYIEPLAKGFAKNAFSYMLFLRLTPAFPFFIVNLVPAFLNVRFHIYFLATLIGIIPATVAFSFAGSGLDSIIAAQEALNPGCAALGNCSLDTSQLVTGELILALFALGLVALIPPAVNFFKSRKATS